MFEEWRPIPGMEGYEASSRGRIRSLDRIVLVHMPCGRVYHRAIKGRILIPNRAGKHRQYPCLNFGKKRGKIYVHRMVCLAFHGEPPTPEHEVAHGNRDTFDNSKNNVRWATHHENEQDKKLHGTFIHPAPRKGEAHHKAKLTDADIIAIRSRLTGRRGELTEIAFEYSMDRSTIARIRDRKGWSHV